MSQIRCNNRTVIDGLEWYCNVEKGHKGDHMYLVVDKDNSEYSKIAKSWKQ